ncbi:MAG: hypothetical protein HQL60_05715 [Magnetococcales bacterium]|nr:hypothetical protein [Magnetococcales bacterium]
MIITSITTLLPSMTDMGQVMGFSRRLPPPAEQVVSRLDQNGDGVVGGDEVQDTRLAARFQDIDGDSDGFISVDELQSAMDTFRQQIRAHQLQSPIENSLFVEDAGTDEPVAVSEAVEAVEEISSDESIAAPDSLSYHLAVLRGLINSLPGQSGDNEDDDQAPIELTDAMLESDEVESSDEFGVQSLPAMVSSEDILAALDQVDQELGSEDEGSVADPVIATPTAELRSSLSYHLARVQQLIDGLSMDAATDLAPSYGAIADMDRETIDQDNWAADEPIVNVADVEADAVDGYWPDLTPPIIDISTFVWPDSLDQQDGMAGDDQLAAEEGSAAEVVPSGALRAGLSEHVAAIQRLIDGLSGQGNDGEVVGDEETLSTPLSPAETVEAMDQDGDGAIGVNEASGALAQRFTVADVDNNGRISEEELAASYVVDADQQAQQPVDTVDQDALQANLAASGPRSFGMARYLSMIQQLATGSSQYLISA